MSPASCGTLMTRPRMRQSAFTNCTGNVRSSDPQDSTSRCSNNSRFAIELTKGTKWPALRIQRQVKRSTSSEAVAPRTSAAGIANGHGIPAPRIDYAISENTRRMMEHGIGRASEILTAAGVAKGRQISAYPAVGPEVTTAGGAYVDVGWTGAHVDGALVTGPAWTAHPAWLAKFLAVLESSTGSAQIPEPENAARGAVASKQ